jgi:hypothetical protein
MARDILDQALDTYTAPPLDDLYEKAGKKFNINPLWLKAQDMHELGPGLNSNAAGSPDHVGHGQIGPAWRKKLGLPDRPTPEQGIMGMAQIMRELLDKHGGDIGAAQVEYTGGPNPKAWGENTRNYPGKVAGYYNDLGGKPMQVSYPEPASQGNVLDDVLKQYGQEDAEVSERPTPNWSLNNEVGYGLTLGGGVAGRAGMEALYKTIEDKQKPQFDKVPFGELLKSNYKSIHADINAGREAYLEENPGTALVAQLGGAAIPTMAALVSGQMGVVAPLGRQIVSSFPRAAPVVNALTGNISKLPEAANYATAGVRALSRAVTGATGGGTAALVQSPMSDKPVGEQVKTGTGLGAILGPTLGAVGDTITSQIAPRVADQANRLLNAGVNLQAGQIPGVSPVLSFLHRKIGDASGAAQRSDLVRALARTFGEEADAIDNPTVIRAQTRIGSMFDQFGKATIHRDEPFERGVIDTIVSARGEGIPDDKVAALDDIGELILAKTGDGKTLTGDQYLNLTKRGSKLDRLLLDPDLGQYASQIRDHLDDALERSVATAGGRWVPAAAAAPGNALKPNGVSGLPRAEENKLLGVGSSGDIRLPQGADGTAVGPWTGGTGRGFTWDGAQTVRPGVDPMGRAGQPGMVWEIDPDTQGALQRLRDARGQYKNLQLVRGIMDNVTGEVQPGKLAGRVQKFYPPAKDRKIGEWERRMSDLQAANQFIPNAAPGAPVSNNRLLHGVQQGVGLGGVVGAVEYGPEILRALKSNPVEYGAALAALLGSRAMVKGGAKALDSTRNARRVVDNAMAPGDYPIDWLNLLTLPPATQLYNKEKTK